MSYCLVGFREDHETYEAAVEAQAVYSTGSTMDTIETMSGFYDLFEIIHMVEDMYGATMVWGVIEDETFVNLRELRDFHDSDNPMISDVESLVKEYLKHQKQQKELQTASLNAIKKGLCPHCNSQTIETEYVQMQGDPTVGQKCSSCNQTWLLDYQPVHITFN